MTIINLSTSHKPNLKQIKALCALITMHLTLGEVISEADRKRAERFANIVEGISRDFYFEYVECEVLLNSGFKPIVFEVSKLVGIQYRETY